MVEHFLAGVSWRTLRAVGDDIFVRNLLAGQNRSEILSWAEGYEAIFIDEAQRIPDVGWALKILIDARPDLRIIATGSSSFQLSGVLGEPLTGRQTPLILNTVSVRELSAVMNEFELRAVLDNMLTYGMYPEVRMADSSLQQREIARELAASYLLKDVLQLERIKSAKALTDLLVLLALQVGSLVSVNELAQQVGLDAKTVSRYLDLLEKAFVVLNLRGFSRNLRSEVTRNGKWYFYDVGIRNALLNNFNLPNSRGDIGAIWENFLVVERMKALNYASAPAALRFWRTWERQEIDLIEDRDGVLHTFEFKWNPRSRAKLPSIFLDTYPGASFEVITPENFMAFVQGP